MRKLLRVFYPLPKVTRIAYLIKACCFISLFFLSRAAFAQTLPPASSCTSGDLILVSATLPKNANEDACGTCSTGTLLSRKLILSINNKTGSTRTSFAFWGTLEIYNSNGTLFASRALTRCKGPIPKNAITPVDFDTIQYPCGKSLKLTNLFLAWTSANSNEICPLNSATINPKCGTLPFVQIVAGLDASFDVVNATCTANGSIAVSPFGGTAPYSVTINGVTHSNIGAGATTNFSLPAGTYSIVITDNTSPTACSTTKERTVGSASAVTANAGDDFTKTCSSYTSGKQIGEASASGFTYSWSPSTNLSNASISDPTANPSVTTTYTVTKTNTATGCSNTDAVLVTVDNTAPTANAGSDVTINCTTPSTTLGATGGGSYSWSPATGLSATNISNPTATPSSTTTYTVTVTAANGCTATDDVIVTVDKSAPTANAGSDVTINCTTPSTTLGATGGGSYSWSPAAGLSATNISNPTATPSSTTTYTVTVTAANGCTASDDVIVTVAKAVPDAPTICVVQPSLCGPAQGSVTILSPTGTGLEYSINNGADWQTGTVFSPLAAGSVSGIKVKNLSSGCVSAAVNCDASNCTNQRISSSAISTDKTAKSQITTQTPTQAPISIKSPINTDGISNKETSVKAFPNPFSDNVKFEVTSALSGNGSLEIINMMGQKIRTVYQGFISAGSQTFELNLPVSQISHLVYVLRIGNKKMTGKLLQINQ